jgi:hypothetical protein
MSCSISTLLISSLQDVFGAPRDLSQSHLKIGGVLPAGFGFPSDVDLWLPADIGSSWATSYFGVTKRAR